MSHALRDLEASVLGAILCRNETLDELPLLEPVDFIDARHRAVFAAMRNLQAARRPVDVVTVQSELEQNGCNLVDYAFLGEVVLRMPTVANAFEYARQVRAASLARRVRSALADVIAADPTTPGPELLSMAMAALSGIDAEQPDDTLTITELLKRRYKQLAEIAEARMNGQDAMTGFPTGVASLDEKIGGWQPGIVSLIAARPGIGKSSLGLSTASAASAAGIGVHLFSLEDTEEAYADRTMSRVSGVAAEKIRNCAMNRGEFTDLNHGVARLRNAKWLVDSRSGISADEIVRSVRRRRRENGTKVVIVDYIQLVKRAPRLNAHEALTEIITTLADAAKQDKLAYVVMSQLNRGIESRPDRRPNESDLRESGSLEERSKCIVGLYRGSHYREPPKKGVDWDPAWEGHSSPPDESEFARQVQLLVLKNSNGRTGRVWATWNGPTTNIS